jgi:YD repeat-containing protein
VAGNAGGHGQETFSYAGANRDQLLSDGSATAITYGLATQYGQPWVQSYAPAQSASPVYVLHDQHGTPLGYLQNGKDYAYITDNLGSVAAIINAAGVTVRTFSYDPFGNVIASTGSGANRSQIGYTGALTDPSYGGIAATGWTHLGAPAPR